MMDNAGDPLGTADATTARPIDSLDLAAVAGPRMITPDTPKETLREIARSPVFERLRQVALELAARRRAVMLREQQAIGLDNQRTTFKAADGLGTLHMRVSQEEFFAMRAKYGEDCWNDPDFIEAYRRDNPYCRVQTTRGTKGQEYGGRRR